MASFALEPGGDAVRALLKLVAQDRPERLIMLVTPIKLGRLHIEDAWPNCGLAGGCIQAPAGLLGPRLIALSTLDIRLSLAWTEACGRRPTSLVSCPVRGRDAWIVIVDVDDRLPDRSAILAAAEALAPLLELGQATRREQDNASRLSALVDHLPAPLVFVDARRLQVFLNDGARTLLDLQTGDLRDTSVSAALARLIGGSDPFEAKRQLAMDPTASMTFNIHHRDQAFTVETLWIDVEGLTGRIWQFRDVTLEQAYQSQLSDLAALLQLTVENVREGVALIDEHLRIILWNADFLNLFGYPDKTVARGSDLLALLRISAERGDLGSGEPDAILETLVESIRSAPNRSLEIHREDGRILDVWRKSLDGGRFILVARDVTDERQVARFKDELVSTASHELRTPVTSILGALRMIDSGTVGELPDTARGLVAIARKNAERLDRLINDLLDLDKLQLGKMPFEFDTLDLQQFVHDAAEQNAPYAGRFGVSIGVEAPDPVQVLADPFRLMQVMANLLSNAAKFSPPGSVVRIRLSADETFARISVIDEGRGISPEFRKRLFERFAQENVTSPDRPSGSGLGLAISRSIIEEHEGTLEVDPTTRIGTTFHIGLRRIAE